MHTTPVGSVEEICPRDAGPSLPALEKEFGPLTDKLPLLMAALTLIRIETLVGSWMAAWVALCKNPVRISNEIRPCRQEPFWIRTQSLKHSATAVKMDHQISPSGSSGFENMMVCALLGGRDGSPRPIRTRRIAL